MARPSDGYHPRAPAQSALYQIVRDPLETFRAQAARVWEGERLRARLREAAMRLTTRGVRILEIALDCGFGDVSNFNRGFRAEFGLSPRAYQQRFATR